jgi:tRNA(Ile)-lysidine synthase
MLTKIKQWINRNDILDEGDKVLVACSGGPDSLALVHLLYRLKDEYSLALAVAHVNHMFRGAESDAEEAFVVDFCRCMNLPCYHAAIDVPAYIETSGRSPQDAARVKRYHYLRQVAETIGGAKIATGHHRDDQAETILLHMFRGAGSAGLSGMKAKGDGIIRPVLDVTRQELESYCQEHGLHPQIDSSNLKNNYLRNYLRRELMPLLEKRFNTNLTETLCRTATLIGDEHEFITHHAIDLWPTVVEEANQRIILDCQRLCSLHIAMQREIFRMAIEKKQGSLKGITFFHVERLLELAEDKNVGSIVELPGGLGARKGYDVIILEALPVQVTPSGIAPPGILLMIPGVTYIEPLGLMVMATLSDVRPQQVQEESVVFDWQRLTPPLSVRTRQDGDRFRPYGLAGSKKLKDFFIDAKVPREKRDYIPIVCDEQGIVGVGACRLAERAMPGDDTKQFLRLTIK